METTEREKLARVLWGGRWAALATHGDGVPLASMVAYACEPGFAGLLLHLSRLSAHTRNLLASPFTSIVISEPDSDRVRNPQTLARVSIRNSSHSRSGLAFWFQTFKMRINGNPSGGWGV